MGKQKTRVTIDYSKCEPCKAGTCMGVCPQGIFEIDTNKKPQIINDSECTLCRICEDLCPTKAITISQK
ncbi:MAG: 4Fe-4S binding protein [Crenarchaeota archaeon]|nr:4Fe-4S binding protein [Thermoproteota archaeon]